MEYKIATKVLQESGMNKSIVHIPKDCKPFLKNSILFSQKTHRKYANYLNKINCTTYKWIVVYKQQKWERQT